MTETMEGVTFAAISPKMVLKDEFAIGETCAFCCAKGFGAISVFCEEQKRFAENGEKIMTPRQIDTKRPPDFIETPSFNKKWQLIAHKIKSKWNAKSYIAFFRLPLRVIYSPSTFCDIEREPFTENSSRLFFERQSSSVQPRNASRSFP
jgi:hypothetical protein